MGTKAERLLPPERMLDSWMAGEITDAEMLLILAERRLTVEQLQEVLHIMADFMIHMEDGLPLSIPLQPHINGPH